MPIQSHVSLSISSLGYKRKGEGLLLLRVPRKYMSELYLLHFLTWTTLQKEQAWHGREYVSTMLKMIRCFMGELFYEEARKIYRKHRCKMKKRRKLPEGWVPPWKRVKGIASDSTLDTTNQPDEDVKL
jgi:hypothetical protein